MLKCSWSSASLVVILSTISVRSRRLRIAQKSRAGRRFKIIRGCVVCPPSERRQKADKPPVRRRTFHFYSSIFGNLDVNPKNIKRSLEFCGKKCGLKKWKILVMIWVWTHFFSRERAIAWGKNIQHLNHYQKVTADGDVRAPREGRGCPRSQGRVHFLLAKDEFVPTGHIFQPSDAYANSPAPPRKLPQTATKTRRHRRQNSKHNLNLHKHNLNLRKFNLNFAKFNLNFEFCPQCNYLLSADAIRMQGATANFQPHRALSYIRPMRIIRLKKQAMI